MDNNKLLEYFGDKLRYELIHPDKDKQQAFPISSPYGVFNKVKKAIDVSSKAGYGIYFTLNEFTNPKHRKKDEFKLARAVWIEDDGDEHGVTPTNFPLAPSCVVSSSPGKYHYYWFTSCDNLEEWMAVMKGMAADYNGDEAGTLVTQVLRVPGYPNTKYEDNPLVAITAGNMKKYSWADIIKAFPPSDAPVVETVTNTKGSLEVNTAINEILTGESLYPNMIRLAASFAVKGISRKDIHSVIGAVLDQADAEPKRITNAKSKLMFSIDDAIAKYAKKQNTHRYQADKVGNLYCTLEWPPGFVGEMARDAYDYMRLGSRELAICAAMHCVSVLGCGCFHLGNVPVNRKRLVLAENGTGKQITTDYFEMLLKQLPHAGISDMFKSENAYSASNLQHDLNEHKCRSVIISEAGKVGSSTAGDQGTLQAQRLKLLSSKIYGGAVSTTAYSKAKQSAISTVKAEPVQDPIFVLLEETTPQTYVDVFHKTKQADSGELARTDIFFIKEPSRADANLRNKRIDIPEPIINHMNKMVQQYFDTDVMDGTVEGVSQKHIEVDYSQVADLMDELFLSTLDMRSRVDNVERGMIVRLHERVATTCIILAAANSLDPTLTKPKPPIVTPEIFNYAVDYHRELNRAALANIRTGTLAGAMEQLMKTLAAKLLNTQDKDEELFMDGNITRQWVARKLRTDSTKFKALRDEMNGATPDRALTAIMNHACDESLLSRVAGKSGQWYNQVS